MLIEKFSFSASYLIGLIKAVMEASGKEETSTQTFKFQKIFNKGVQIL